MVNFDTPKEQIETTLAKEDDKINDVENTNLSVESSKDITPEEFRSISIQIRELERQVRIWRKKREELNSQVIEKTKVRNQKNEEVKSFIADANDHKTRRDEFNKQISLLKEQKLVVDAELKESEKHYEELPQTTEEIPKNMNSQLKKFQKEMKNLEWKLQTQTFSLEEERVLVDKIADLDKKIEDLAEFKNLSKEKTKSYYSMRKLKNQMFKMIREMNTLVKESRAHHKQMIESFSKANSARKEADAVHADILKVKTQADLIHSEFVEKIKLKRSLTNRIKKYSQKIQADQKEKETQAIKEKSTNVLQKTKDGKKISFEDFKSLIDLGLI